MIAVVSGASGFIGANLVEALVADGIEVRLLRRPGVTYAPAPRGTTAHVADLAASDAHELPVWHGVTHVFHLGGRTRAVHARDFTAANVQPTARLAAALARRATPPRLILVSSQAAAGPAPAADRPLTGDEEPRPLEAYGRSKREAELVVRSAALPWVIVRPAAVYGPRDRDFLQLFQQMASRLALQAVPPWHCVSLAHVSDVVSVLRGSAGTDAALGGTFFVEDGAPATWAEVYDEVGAVLRRSPPRWTVPAAVLQGAALASELAARLSATEPLLTRNKLALARHPWWVCDATSTRRVLDWRPAIARADGWAQTLEWYREAQWLRS